MPDEQVEHCTSCGERIVIGTDRWGSRPMTTERVQLTCENEQCPNHPQKGFQMSNFDISRCQPNWRRIILKLSGEAFAGPAGFGIDGAVVRQLAQEVVAARDMGVDVAVVIGGGNIWRGMIGVGAGMDRAQADYMGMLATVINGLALQDTLEQMDQPTRVMTALNMEQIAEPYIRRRAMRHLEKDRVVILAGGLGAPFFTTDTPAALRAAELSAGVVIKGTHGGVDGIYTADPRVDPDATKLNEVTYLDVLNKGLAVMDPTSITFCMDNKLPIIVYDAMTPGNLARVLRREDGVGTLVR